MRAKNGRTNLTVSLTSAQKDYIRSQAAATGCDTPSEYIQKLVDADRKAHGDERLEREIAAGLDSPAREMTGKQWSKLRRTLSTKLAKRRKAQ